MRFLILITSWATLLLTGCAVSRPPSPSHASRRTTAGEVVTLGVGAGAGAAIGSVVDSNSTRGAIIGGVAGLAGGAVVNNFLSDAKATQAEEYRLQGYRQGVMETMQDYWDATRMPSNSAPASQMRPEIYYPPGTYSGIEFHPSSGSTPPSLNDRIRY